MPLKSRKQQKWYNATNQNFLDDKPSSHRKVEEYSIRSVASWWDNKTKAQKGLLFSKMGYPVSKEDVKMVKEYKFMRLPKVWQDNIRKLIFSPYFSVTGKEKLSDFYKFYDEGEEQSEAPDQPFTLRRYIRDQSYSQLPTEIRGNTINLAQQGQEAKQPIGLRSMGKYKYVESGKFTKRKEKKSEHICEKLKNTIWEMTDPRRPILPSENVGITNTHPHCKCIWETWTEVETEPSYVGHTLRPTLNGRSLEDFSWKKTGIDHVGKVDQIIQDKYKNKTLQKIDKEGNLIGTMESRAEEKTCPECNGTGIWHTNLGDKCPTCKGTGKLPPPPSFHANPRGDPSDEALAQGYNTRAKKFLLAAKTGQPSDYRSTTPIDDAIEDDFIASNPIPVNPFSSATATFQDIPEETEDEKGIRLAKRKNKWRTLYPDEDDDDWDKSISGEGEYYQQQLENVRTCNCPAKTVGLMMGEVAAESWEANGQGKKIKGILAYSGISHNKRLYLPEVLAKGDGKTVPLIFNHATTAGIEQELPSLPHDIRRRIQNSERIQVGEVKLHWKAEDLTMFYEGIVTQPFFINEIENDKMTVSLGMIFDADSPKVCDVECYTVVKGGEFNEVSLVYHPGFPIASIEANEAYLKAQIREYGHTIYEGIEQENMEDIWENMSDLQKVTLVKIADLEEKYPNATTHEWNDFSGECVEQLVRAYNGEQSTVEPTNIVDQNTNIVKDNEVYMEYKNISNELDKMIDGRKTPTQKALEAIAVLIEAQTATQIVPDILGVYPLEDAIKDVTIIKWDNRNHVLPNRKLAILNTLRNRHPELTNVPERSHDSYKPSRSYSDDTKFDGETPFASLPKIIKDDLKQLGFEVRLDLPKGLK